MPISLDDAVERAKLMSDNSGLLAQESYNLLLNALGDEDRYAFTMALVDHGIISKQGNTDRVRKLLGNPQTTVLVQDSLTSDQYLANKFANIAKRQLNAQYEIDEEGNPITSYGGTEKAPFQDNSAAPANVDQEAVNNLRSTLENFGISIDPQGKVSFYKSSVPGIYTDRLPQSMPLESALAYYQQVSAIAGKEAEKATRILDSLAKLSVQENDISTILEDLKGVKFSQQSKSDFIVGISKNLESLVSTLSSDANAKMVEYIQELESNFEQYKFDQEAKRDQFDVTADVLSELTDAKENHPELYNAVITGLGGI
jgi:rubrerythrin